jgi:hypothetical protein
MTRGGEIAIKITPLLRARIELLALRRGVNPAEVIEQLVAAAAANGD